MGLFKWLEKRLFTGAILRDYGVFRNANLRIASLRTSLLLCRRRGKLSIVVRTVGLSPLSASAQYMHIDVTPEALRRLEEMVSDIKSRLESPSSAPINPSQSDSVPPVISSDGA